jgi:hypothetical protein
LARAFAFPLQVTDQGTLRHGMSIPSVRDDERVRVQHGTNDSAALDSDNVNAQSKYSIRARHRAWHVKCEKQRFESKGSV